MAKPSKPSKPKRIGRRVAIVDGLRTPFCKAGTEFGRLTSLDLSKVAVQELLARTEIDPKEIDMLVYGNVVPTVAAANVAREVVFAADLPREIHATTVMRACASSIESTTNAANAIALGNAEVAITGGVDCLSDVPILFSRSFSDALVKASRAKTLPDKLKAFADIRPKHLLPVPPAIGERSTGKTMGQHAEAMAKENGISRKEQDEFALRSHMLAAAGTEDGRLTAELAPVYIPEKGKAVTADNHIRPDTTYEALSKLRPAFDKKYGSVTAGNSCPVTDGAAALLVMSEEKAKALGYEPLGYIRGYANAAVDPKWQLLIGPTFATARVLERTGLTLKDMDLVDFHEAFAAQILSNVKAMASRAFAEEHLGRGEPVGEIDMDRFNVMGGSIALGHPFAATAGRQIVTVLNELKRRGQNLALIAQCAAGAMGAAMVLERE
jgi:acetyl-CoA acyltransferase